MNEIIMLSSIVAAGIIVKIISNIYKFEDYEIVFKNPRKKGLISIFVIFICIIPTIINSAIISKYIMGTEYTVISDILTMLPAIFVFLIQKDSLKSVGVTRKNILYSVVLGLGLAALFILVINVFIKHNENYNPVNQQVSILINTCITGFSEEILFRGYLQTRLISWIGKTKGWILTAVIFSLFHFPNVVILGQFNILNGLINCFMLIPAALLLGYIMLKTKNIIASSILHSCFDWISDMIM